MDNRFSTGKRLRKAVWAVASSAGGPARQWIAGPVRLQPLRDGQRRAALSFAIFSIPRSQFWLRADGSLPHLHARSPILGDAHPGLVRGIRPRPQPGRDRHADRILRIRARPLPFRRDRTVPGDALPLFGQRLALRSRHQRAARTGLPRPIPRPRAGRPAPGVGRL